MTTRTTPPTRRSTSASVVSQPCSACHHRRITSSLVHASNTASAGAWNVRSMRTVLVSVTSQAPGGVAGSCAPRAALRGRRVRQCVLEHSPVRVLVVPVPPPVGLRLRIALRRVLPDLLAPERGDVEVGPGAAHRLVAALVDEVGAEDPVVVAQEGVGAVPLVHAEVGVEV